VKFYRKDDQRRKDKAWRNAWFTASVGIEVAGCIVVGLLVGYFADNRLDTYPYIMIVGFAAGVAAAGKALWRVIKREMSDGSSDGDNGKQR
jgi:F0F1-type ATP synthase assembly protein I